MNTGGIEPVLASPRLPTLPAVAIRIVALAQRDDVTIDEIASILSADPALAVKILKTANSALYARSRPARSVREAILVLGLRSVRALALGFSLVHARRRGSGQFFDYELFWSRSIAAACVCRTIATVAGSWHREEAFLGGLLHGIGILALEQFDGKSYSRLYNGADGDRTRLREIEQEAYGFDHAALGAALSERWALPSEMVAAIREHLNPDLSGEVSRPHARLLSAAATGSDALVGGAGVQSSMESYRLSCSRWWGMELAEADALLAQAADDAAVTRSLLDVRASAALSSVEILAMANEELARLSAQSAEETAKLEDENQVLRVAASTDPLTGVANRRGCHEFLDSCLRSAARSGSPLSLLMVDIDHFKSVNDVYGHQAGDEFLVQVATILQESVRLDDLVARFGGEEFAVILPRTTLAGAVGLAERLRTAIESSTMQSPSGREARVTVSIGVAAHDRAIVRTAEELFHAVDVALYRAKRAGRNRVVGANCDEAA